MLCELNRVLDQNKILRSYRIFRFVVVHDKINQDDVWLVLKIYRLWNAGNRRGGHHKCKRVCGGRSPKVENRVLLYSTSSNLKQESSKSIQHYDHNDS